MKVPVRVPSSAGTASSAGACSTSACGVKPVSSSGFGSMNIVFAKSAWYGCVVTTRTAIRCAGSAPANASIDIERLLVAEVRRSTLSRSVLERLLGELLVALPPDPALGGGLAHDELVLRRAAGVLARVDGHRAAFGDAAPRRARSRARRARVSMGSRRSGPSRGSRGPRDPLVRGRPWSSSDRLLPHASLWYAGWPNPC